MIEKEAVLDFERFKYFNKRVFVVSQQLPIKYNSTHVTIDNTVKLLLSQNVNKKLAY